MGDPNVVAAVRNVVPRISAAADGILAAANKFKPVAQQFDDASIELEAAVQELVDTSSSIRVAERELVEAAITGNVDVNRNHIAALQTYRPMHRNAEERRRAAEEKLKIAQRGLLTALREVRVAGDQVRIVAGEVPVAVDSPVDEYREIANLKAINDDAGSLHQYALKDWQRQQNDLAMKVSRRENNRIDLTNQIFNIIGWYAVFQGVVLTAVAQLAQANTGGDKLPMCKKIWFPIVLTAFSTVVIVSGIIYKFHGLEALEATINDERDARSAYEARIRNLRREGPLKFRFSVHAHEDREKIQTPRAFWKNSIPVIVSLLLFTGLFIMSYITILCDKLEP